MKTMKEICDQYISPAIVEQVMSELDAAGYVIVPKAPTVQMLNAASEALVPSGDALACWHAMTAQTQKGQPPG